MTTNGDPFEQFLSRLAPEEASSSERYSSLRARLVKYFQWKRCEDPEGLSDETIGRLVKKLYAGERIERPSSYAYGIAQNVFREHLRWVARLAQVRDLQEVAIEGLENASLDEFEDCARPCLEKLSDDRRRVLERYYSEEVSREELALQMGLSVPALRTKIHRLKADLKECYEKCMKGS